MFERFTEAAIKVIMIAQEQARILHRPEISIAHMVLGIIGVGHSNSARCLKDAGFDRLLLQQAARLIHGFREEYAYSTEMPFDDKVKAVMKVAMEYANAVGDPVIRVDYLMMAILKTADFDQILSEINIEPKPDRAFLMQTLMTLVMSENWPSRRPPPQTLQLVVALEIEIDMDDREAAEKRAAGILRNVFARVPEVKAFIVSQTLTPVT